MQLSITSLDDMDLSAEQKKRRLLKIIFEWSRIGKRRRVRTKITWDSFIQETTKINYEVFPDEDRCGGE